MAGQVIKVDNLSKRYRIGAAEKGYKTLREAIVEGVTAPVRNFLKLHRLTSFKGDNEQDVVWALKDVSFEVKEGEVVGVIGRNGGGKSTLLKILSRITEPTSGSAEIHGRVSSLLEVGTGFHPELTGRENIFLNGAILGMRKKEIKKKFDEIVAFSEIGQFIDTPVKRYSSGMYVRLAFAVAAQLEPEILLVDEVLAVGDAAFQKKCVGKMEQVAGGGRTVIIVSHNMPLISNLCQRAILLDKGRIIKEGKATEVVQDYLTTARSAGGEVVWPDKAQAPGNEMGRLRSIRILQDGFAGPTPDVDIAREVAIEIEYWNLRDAALLHMSVDLVTGMGVTVLSTSNARVINLEDDEWYGRPLPPGLFRVVCRIPPNFLNEGRYRVTVTLVKTSSHTPEARQEDVLSFDAHDSGEMRKGLGFYTGWPGVVRPRLAWRTEYLGTKE